MYSYLLLLLLMYYLNDYCYILLFIFGLFGKQTYHVNEHININIIINEIDVVENLLTNQNRECAVVVDQIFWADLFICGSIFSISSFLSVQLNLIFIVILLFFCLILFLGKRKVES